MSDGRVAGSNPGFSSFFFQDDYIECVCGLSEGVVRFCVLDKSGQTRGWDEKFQLVTVTGFMDGPLWHGDSSCLSADIAHKLCSDVIVTDHLLVAGTYR